MTTKIIIIIAVSVASVYVRHNCLFRGRSGVLSHVIFFVPILHVTISPKSRVAFVTLSPIC